MAGTQFFGYLLVALSAMLLAQHWNRGRDLAANPSHPPRPRDRRDAIRQLQRRSVASALIGVVGAAMTLVDRVPRNPLSMSAYLFGLTLGGAVIFAIALADLRAARVRRDAEHLDLVARELQKATAAPPQAGSDRKFAGRLMNAAGSEAYSTACTIPEDQSD